MGPRTLVIGLAVTGVMASSCASTARDAFMEAYNEETSAASYSDTCVVDARTHEVVAEAYLAQTGQRPQSESDLVPDYLRESPNGWEFDATVATSFAPIAGGRCSGYEVIGNGSSIGQEIAEGLDNSQSVSCSIDKRLVETAVETHFATKGFDAVSIEELTEYGVNAELNHWTLETPATSATTAPTVVAIVGGPCDN